MWFLPKDYVWVHTRVQKAHDTHKDKLSIETNFEIKDKIVFFTAKVTIWEQVFNWSSFWELGREKAFEKLETVAVGRALAFAGFEIKEGIASRDEIDRFEAKKDKNGAYKWDSSQMELTEYIDIVRNESDVNNLDTIYKDFSRWNWSEKQKKWMIEECAKKKAELTGWKYIPKT